MPSMLSLYLLALVMVVSARWEAVDIIVTTAATGVKVHNNILFIADGDGGLRIVDAAVPEQLRHLSTLDIPGNCIDVILGPTPSSSVYVICQKSGLHKVNVTSPQKPSLVESLNVSVDMQMGDCRGGYAFITDLIKGLIVVNINDMRVVTVVGMSGGATSVAMLGELIFVLNGTDIVTLSASLNRVGDYSPYGGGRVNSLAASNTLLFVLVEAQVQVLKVNPLSGSVAFIRSIDVRPSSRLTISGDTGYLSGRIGGMQLIENINTPSDVEVVDSTLSPSWMVEHVQIYDGVAYLAMGTEGLATARPTPSYPVASLNNDVFPAVFLDGRDTVRISNADVFNFSDFAAATRERITISAPTTFPIVGILSLECGHYFGCDVFVSVFSNTNSDLVLLLSSSGWEQRCNLKLLSSGIEKRGVTFFKHIPTGKLNYQFSSPLNNLIVLAANGNIHPGCVS